VPPELIKLTFEIARKGVRTLERQTISFKPDEEIIPGVAALALPGHTPGHSGFLFQFGDEPFIAAGDFAHDPLLQLAPRAKSNGQSLALTSLIRDQG